MWRERLPSILSYVEIAAGAVEEIRTCFHFQNAQRDGQHLVGPSLLIIALSKQVNDLDCCFDTSSRVV